MANFLEVILRCLMVSVLSCRVESGIDANHDLFQGFRTTNSPANGRKGTETSRDDIETGVPIIPEIIPEELPTKCEYPDQRMVILTGPQGPPGSPGPRGMPGPPGIPGYSGMNGHNGEPGVCNCRKGPKGTTGPVGRQGPMGNEGSRGPQGLPGDEGSRGLTGQKGEPGNCTGAGLKGEAGPPGPPGKRGVTGEKGEIGEPGEDAVCDAQFDRSGTEQSTDAERNSDRKFSAFSVSRYGTAEAEDDTTIVTWDHEFSNVGGDFSPDTGIFNCSIPGFYYFTFHIYKSSTGNYPMVRLMLNGEVQVSIIDADYWDSEDSSSNSVILELGLGDAVWLDLYHGRVLHSSYYRYTTFSGTIIHAA